MRSSATDALNLLGWKTLDKRRMFHRVVMAFKCLNGHLDFNFGTKSKKDFHGKGTIPEEKLDIRLPIAKRNWENQRLISSIFKEWNSLDPNV